MKFFHLSDLHIGKQLHHYNLKEDQQWILREIIDYAKELHPDAILVAGDIYDKSVPSGEAVELFDWFLTELSELEPAVPILLIAGNHDSAQRLDYARGILDRQHIYIAGKPPEAKTEYIRKVTLTDAYGEVDFYLLPFLRPGYVRPVFEEQVPEGYTETIQALLEREKIDWSRRNVLLSHQFYAGAGEEPQTCDSESISVGGLDCVDASAVSGFDYVALGHLHGAQRVKQEHIRYCGTLLKYSVSEEKQKKALHVVTIEGKGTAAKVERLPLHPLRDVRSIRGELQELIESALPENKEDYVSVTLTDEVDPYKPKEQLEKVYSHILEIRTDNTRTRKRLEAFDEEVHLGDPLTVFGEFYREMQGKDLSEQEQEILRKTLEEAEEE